jgi:hypothetical protein
MSNIEANSPELTPDVAAKIIEALRNQKTRDTAAGAAGVRREQLEEWLKRDATFALDVEEAELDTSMARLTLMRQRAKVGHPVDRQWLKRHRLEVEDLERRVAEMQARRAN